MSDHSSGFKIHQLVLSRSPLHLNREIVIEIEKRLGLSFLNEDQPHRVCFANQNAELQDAYKQVFSAIDLLDYVYAMVISKQGNFDNISLLSENQSLIAYPTDPLQFWQLVRDGQNYRRSMG
ncbi:hypothetical protein [Acinetobacter vivianii]|uniref:hypothetical protein n=1 Tax=Acinetobacter vivianii TaxID=1776742 RepID=UPI001904723C|nr:hypothetical protein [Acinetobacter vivianii]MBJ8484688.1 hypothetical protein [Acinetobacter vivianii]